MKHIRLSYYLIVIAEVDVALKGYINNLNEHKTRKTQVLFAKEIEIALHCFKCKMKT